MKTKKKETYSYVLNFAEQVDMMVEVREALIIAEKVIRHAYDGACPVQVLDAITFFDGLEAVIESKKKKRKS